MIGFSLSLLDGENFNINKLDSKKRINLAQIDKIFKVFNKIKFNNKNNNNNKKYISLNKKAM